MKRKTMLKEKIQYTKSIQKLHENCTKIIIKSLD